MTNDNVVVAIPANDDILKLYLHKKNIEMFEGSEDDVLFRYYSCALFYTKLWEINGNDLFIARVTADCPFLNIDMIKAMNKICEHIDCDFVTNCFLRTFPDGQDYEIISARLLSFLQNKLTSGNHHREHVTSYLYEHKTSYLYKYSNSENYKTISYSQFKNESHIKTSIDTIEEYNNAVKAYNNNKI
jgi:spore coat polysaccharide biosynthesis protein SpsF (cytidylyltransferase family)